MHGGGAVAAALSAILLPEAFAVRLNRPTPPPLADDDPCKCLPWKEVYSSGKAVCGEFAELAGLQVPQVDHTLVEISEAWATKPERMMSLCKEFLPKLDENYCIPLWEGLERWGSWCYTSNRCPTLDVGKHLSDKDVGGGVILKREIAGRSCAPWERRLDRDLTPEQLYAVAKKSKINLVDAIKNTYEMWWGTSWVMYSKAWATGNFTGELKRKVLTDRPIYMPLTMNNRESMVVLWFDKVWDVFLSPKRCPETKYCIQKRPEEMPIPPNATIEPPPRWTF